MATEISSLFARIGADISGLVTGLNTSKSMLTDVGRQMQSTGVMMTAGLTLPLAGVGIAAAKAATDLDKEMRNIQSISKQSDESLAALSETFVTMSTDMNVTRDSAALLAQGFYQIQSSGFAGQDAMMVLEASTKAASAGLTTTETAVRGIAAVLNAYSLSAGDAAHISDVMFKAVDVGMFTFGELSNAIGDTLGTASAAKVPIETIAAALATMTKAGINVNEATTSMNQLLLSIVDPSDGAAKAAEALGLNFDAAHLAAVGLPKVLDEIRVATGGDIEALSELFPNVRALRGALALMRGEGATFAEDLGKISDASGATTAAFEIQNKSFAAMFDNMKNKGTATLIELGQIILPMLIEFLDAVNPLITSIKEGNPEWIKWALVIGGVLAAAGPVLTIIGTLITVITALASPIGIVIAAVGLLGAAWATNFGGIQEIAASTMTSIQNLIQMMITGDFKGGIFGLNEDHPVITFLLRLREFALGLPAQLQTFFDTIKSGAETGLAALSERFEPIISGFRELWAALSESAPQIKEAAEVVWAALNRIFGAMGPEAMSNLDSALTNMIALIGNGLSTAAEFWREHGDTIIAIISGAALAIGLVIGGLVTLVTAAIEGLTVIFRGQGEAFQAIMRGDFIGAFEALVSIVPNLMRVLWDALRNIMEMIFAMFNTSGDQIYRAGQEIIRGLINGVTSMAGALWNEVSRIANESVNVIMRSLGIHSPSEVFAEVGKNMVAGLAQGLTEAKGMAAGAMSTLAGGAVPAFGAALPGGESGELGRTVSATFVFNVNNGMDLAELKAVIREVLRG